MKVEEVQERLEDAGLVIETKERTPNDKAWQLRLTTGEGCCVYDTGSVVPEGKNQGRLREILGVGKLAEKVVEAARAGEYSSFTDTTGTPEPSWRPCCDDGTSSR
jgi:hypothetical protein